MLLPYGRFSPNKIAVRAIDTNIVVRLTAHDDPVQQAISEALIRQPFMILPTVLMEAVWVLQTSFKLPPLEIVRRLGLLLGNPNADCISGEAVNWALHCFAKGADFADALHLALASEAQATALTTFDRGISQISTPPIPIETLA